MSNKCYSTEMKPCPTPAMFDPSELNEVIVFLPHADDESIGCGGTIAMLCDAGKRVHLVLVSDSSGAGGLPHGSSEIRRNELLRAAEILGVTEKITFWNIPDGSVSACADLSQRITEIAIEKNAKTAFCPWPMDVHPDHSAVGQAVATAHSQGSFSEGVWFYEVWTPLNATHIVDISAVWERKKNALEAHVTALSCADYIRAIEGLSLYRSLLSVTAGREGSYCEAFNFWKIAVKKEPVSFRTAIENDGTFVTTLFVDVFKTDTPDGWWSWKYAKRNLIGSVGTRQDGTIISFYGALERVMIADGLEYSVCQLGDVMVDASMRGWGGKKGIFYHTSYAFLNQHVGDAKTFSLGYGFPTPRALALGIRLGLYRQADKLLYWHRESRMGGGALGVSVRSDKAAMIDEWEWVNTLASPIDAIAPKSVWMKKTAHYWKWRYADRPGYAYDVIRIYRWGRLQGAAVVQQRPTELEIMDIVFSKKKGYETVLRAVERYAFGHQIPTISSWGTDVAISTIDNVLHGETEDAGWVTLPGEILGASMSEKVINRLYLLGGDTDFR